MTREEKLRNIESVNYEIEQAQKYLSKAADELESKGMINESDKLMKIVYKLSDLDRKYI